MLLLFVCFSGYELEGAILYVNSSLASGGDGQSWATSFPKIQDAIYSASSNDEIWVAAGTYRENLILRDGVSLFGGFEGTETSRSQRNWNVRPTILDGGNTNRVVNAPLVLQPTRLDGFVIRNGRADFGAGIYAAGGEFISANNLMVHNSGDGVFGGGGAFVDATVCFPDQTPIQFFTNIANRLLQLHSTNLSISNIPIFPTNKYSPEVHRLLQLAANIYDATTSNKYPTIFRPQFQGSTVKAYITNFVVETNSVFLANALTGPIQDKTNITNPDGLVWGIPVVMGTKKGFPSFNEFSVETFITVRRRLQVQKQSTNFPPVFIQTNQMYVLGISNIFGVEGWNSYTQNFSSQIRLIITNTFSAFITDENGAIIWPANGSTLTGNSAKVTVANWLGSSASSSNTNSFILPYLTNFTFLTNSQYLVSGFPAFNVSATNFENNVGFPIPKWILNFKSRILYCAIDISEPLGRVVDFVSLETPITQIDLSQELLRRAFPEPQFINGMWNTNRLGGSTNINVPTIGIANQLNISMGMPVLNDSDWNNYNSLLPPGPKETLIDSFRRFMGLTPLYEDIPMPSYTVITAPFTATRRFYHRISLQANDPLVHFQLSDLTHDLLANRSEPIIPPNSPPPESNLLKLNDACRPPFYFPEDFKNPAFQDKEIGWSSDWNFPTGSFFNLQWLDKIHRGTPWQTIYTGASSEPADWQIWSGSSETNPTNDWKILEMFFAERNSFGTSLTLSSPIYVNNTFAANTGNGGAASIATCATFLNNIIAENSSGLLRLPVTNEAILQTNCVFNNAQYDYNNLSNQWENLAANPQFVSSANDNFHLLATSPCVDAGSDSALTSGWLLNEPARVEGANLDLGSFELSADDAPVFVSASVSNGSNQFTFQVTGLSGESYVIETSTDLIQWIPISTNITANGFFILNDPFGGASNRFYRASHLP